MTRRAAHMGVGLVFGLLTVLVLTACEGTDGGGYGHPVIWPQSARLGDSIAFLVGSNSSQGNTEPDYDLSVENVKIRLDDGPLSQTITPDAIIETPIAPTSQAAVTNKGLMGTWAIFTLPDWPELSLPATLSVTLLYNDVPSSLYVNTLEILGSGGGPAVFQAAFPPTFFAPRPMVRFRPKWNANTGVGFNPAWNIGAVEFTLRYPIHPVYQDPGGQHHVLRRGGDLQPPRQRDG